MFGNLGSLGQSDVQRAIEVHESFVRRVAKLRDAGASDQELKGIEGSISYAGQAIADGDGPLALAQLESGMAPNLLGALETKYLGSVHKYDPDDQRVIPINGVGGLSTGMKIGLGILGAGLGILVWRRYK
jgi:hypothetical protein